MEKGQIEIERGSERNFGITFAVVFALIGVYRLWVSGNIPWWAFAVSAAFLAVAIFVPSILRIPNYWWSRFGLFLGKIIGPFVMAVVYIVTLVPMGLYVRLTGKDILHLKLDPESKSYWIARETPPQPMKNQF